MYASTGNRSQSGSGIRSMSLIRDAGVRPDDAGPVAVRDAGRALQRLAAPEPVQDLDQRLLALADDAEVDGRLVEDSLRGGGCVLAAQDQRGVGEPLAHELHQLARGRPLAGEHAPETDHVGFRVDPVHDLLQAKPAEPDPVLLELPDLFQGVADAVHRGDLVAGLPRRGRQVRQPERRDGDGGDVVRGGDQLRRLDQAKAHEISGCEGLSPWGRTFPVGQTRVCLS